MTSVAGPAAPDPTAITVRGNASAEELAAVLAVVSSGPRASDGYARWRVTRLAALRRPPSRLDDRE